MEHTAKSFAAIGTPRMLVVGDLILDRYTWGNADRISPEAPVLVLDAQSQEVRLGGAASVAGLTRCLDARISLAGVVGDDSGGQTLCRLLDGADIDHRLLVCDPKRPTTCKERFMGRAAGRHPHQILRVDHEIREPLDDDLERKLADQIVARIGDYQAVLISDYSKGVCTPALLKAVIEAAHERDLPVIVDPAKIEDYSRYLGATLLTPNRVEAELATGQKIDTPADALKAGRRLCELCRAEAILITLDSQGMALVGKNEPGQLMPTQARSVYDITGAGDMVLATVGLGLAAGTPLVEAVRLANVAAGLEVQRLGVAPVSRAEIQNELAGVGTRSANKLVTLDQMTDLARSYRRDGRRLVFTNGCFDLLHVGHARYLKEAAGLGDVLVVAVNSDQSVRRQKGSHRPIINQQDRAALLSALGPVDHVLIFDADTPHDLLRRLRPDVLVKGGTYTTDQVVGCEVVESQGGRVCVTGRTDGVSTTKILATIHDCEKPYRGCGPTCCNNGPQTTLENGPTHVKE